MAQACIHFIASRSHATARLRHSRLPCKGPGAFLHGAPGFRVAGRVHASALSGGSVAGRAKAITFEGNWPCAESRCW